MAYGVHSHEDRRFNALLAYLLLGVLGGAIAATTAAFVFRFPATLETATDPFLSAAPVLVLGAATLGGVVAGWFIAAVVVSRAPGKLRCPAMWNRERPHRCFLFGVFASVRLTDRR